MVRFSSSKVVGFDVETFFLATVHKFQWDEGQEIWCEDINQNGCKNLTDSTPSHIQKVIKNKDYHTNTSASTII